MNTIISLSFRGSNDFNRVSATIAVVGQFNLVVFVGFPNILVAHVDVFTFLTLKRSPYNSGRIPLELELTLTFHYKSFELMFSIRALM